MVLDAGARSFYKTVFCMIAPFGWVSNILIPKENNVCVTVKTTRAWIDFSKWIYSVTVMSQEYLGTTYFGLLQLHITA